MPAEIQYSDCIRVPPSALLAGKIARLRRKQVTVAALTGLALAVVVGVEMVALAMFLDWWLELPWLVRLFSLLGQAFIAGYLLFNYCLSPILHPMVDDDLALQVEKARPELRGRFIAALQLTRPAAIPPGASAAMVDALVEETEAAVEPLDFQAIVATDKLKKLGALAGFITLLGLAGFVYGRSVTVDLMRRVFLSNTPVPRKTKVVVLEANKIIGRGDNVRLEALAQGIVPASGRVVVRHHGRREQEYSLERDQRTQARFARQLENVQDSFLYQVRLNDGVSAWHEVQTVPRPTVATMTCEQEFPAYTQLQPVRRSAGDLTLLAGSRLKLHLTATKDIESALLKGAGIELSKLMQINSQSPRELTAVLEIPAHGLTGFAIQMRDRAGMESRDTAVYRIEVIPDKPPVIRLTYPERKEELITRQATMIIGLDLQDDFAIAKVHLHYQVDTRDAGAEQVVELDLGAEQPQRLRRRHEWKIGAFAPLLPEGSRIEYWITAEDNNNVTGPGRGASEHQFARVVSSEEKRADLLNRAGDYLGSINDLASDQETLNRNLGALIREKRSLK